MALGVGPIVAHHPRYRFGGQRAAHLQIGDHLETVLLAQNVQCGDPVLGVRAAGQGDGACRRDVAVGAVDDPDVGEGADTSVVGGFGQVVLGFEHGGPEGQPRYAGVVEQCPGAGVVPVGQFGELVAAGPLRGDVLTPGERGGDQRHAEQCDGGAADGGRTGQSFAHPRCGHRDVGGGRAAVAQRLLDEAHGQVGQDSRNQQNRQTVEELGVLAAGVGEPEDQQRPVPQVQRVGHGAELHQRFGGQQPIGSREPVPCGWPGSAVGPGQDEQRGGADGHQRPRSGELLDAVDERPAGQYG